VENHVAKAILGGWSVENIFQARSSAPVDVQDVGFSAFDDGLISAVRPDLVPGQPLYLLGANCATVMQGFGVLLPGQGCPGGKALNPNAFTDPPSDPITGNPLRPGTTPRNFLRGFGAAQWDFALHRGFAFHEQLKLQFRAELFNVLNHPSFAQPIGAFFPLAFGGPAVTNFGISTQTLNEGLAGFGTAGAGSFNPLYQMGGPRSVQFALKLVF
jgi:hypothetical protein